MIDAFDIYLFGLLLNLKNMFENLGFLLTFTSLFLIIFVPVIYDYNLKAIKPVAKKLGIIVFSAIAFCMIGKGLSPTKEIATAMFVVPPVVNNEKVQEIPKNILDFVNGWLKENTPKKNSKEF